MSADLADTQPQRPQRDKPGPTRPSRPSQAPAATQASRVQRGGAPPAGVSRQVQSTGGAPPPRATKRGRVGHFFRRPWVAALLTVFLTLTLVTMASAATGWSVGRVEFQGTATFEAGLYMLEQYNQALEEIEAGNYNLARERLEFIFQQNPEFLNIADLWVQVNLVLSGTIQPTSAELPAATATPTEDPRPKEELLAAAQALLAARDWTPAIDTLLALRKTDPSFHTAQVDSMFYAALRNRGVQQILELGLFEGGLYDFSLAEKFGPLDGQALNYREWARLYLYGNAFWYAYPLEAAYYYGQLVGAAPELRDASGLTAFYRYSQSLIHYADQLAADEDWCAAYAAYQTALAARSNASVAATAEAVWQECLALTPTDAASGTPTATGTLAPTSAFSATPTHTFTQGPPTATFTPGAPSSTSLPSNTPLPSSTPTPSPTP